MSLQIISRHVLQNEDLQTLPSAVRPFCAVMRFSLTVFQLRSKKRSRSEGEIFKP